MKFRLWCFASHLAVSIVIALLALCLVFLLWYPAPLDAALGVASIFLLLLSIDVIVGPLLTLLVAKQGKKTLKMDLLTIAVLQLAALSYGLYIVAQGRPVWIVYDANRFELVQAYEAVKTPLSSVASLEVGFSGPQWAAVNESLPDGVRKGDAYYQAEFLRTFDSSISEKITATALPLGVLDRFNDPTEVAHILRGYPEANAFVPLAAKQKSLAVLVNKSSGTLIAIVDLSPW